VGTIVQVQLNTKRVPRSHLQTFSQYKVATGRPLRNIFDVRFDLLYKNAKLRLLLTGISITIIHNKYEIYSKFGKYVIQSIQKRWY